MNISYKQFILIDIILNILGMPMMSGLAPTNMVGSSMTMPIMSNGVTSQMGLMGKILTLECNGQ
jgi:hypothetical protein